MAHKTLIDGTAYDVKGGKCLVDGSGYSVKKGRTLIDGTGYDISFTKMVTVTITVSLRSYGVEGYAYATINGVTYARVGTTSIQVPEGTVVSVSVSQSGGISGSITKDGVVVAQSSTIGVPVSYGFVVTRDTSISLINNYYSYQAANYGQATITTQ